jgi:hypothetical protein
LCLILSACGGNSGGANAPRGPNIGAPDTPWKQKTRDEKQGFMASHIEPTMRHLFQHYDKNGYAEFKCGTCHGEDMEFVNFKMPNSLYALPEKDTIASATDYNDKITKFMVDDVVPTFAKMMHEKPGDPNGVSCFTCHPKDE